MIDRYITIGTLADRLQVGVSTIYRWVAENRFPAPMEMTNGTSRWNVTDVEAWLAERKRKGREPGDDD
jgi:prophage regulatory protein